LCLAVPRRGGVGAEPRGCTETGHSQALLCRRRASMREGGVAGDHGLEASTQWNSRIRFSSALTAGPISFLPPASSSSSTTNNSRTNPSAASPARRSAQHRSAPRAHRGAAAAPTTRSKPAPPAPAVARKPLCRLSRRRDVRCSAASASSSGAHRQPAHSAFGSVSTGLFLLPDSCSHAFMRRFSACPAGDLWYIARR
jgi:hypothetical protein